MVGRNVTRYSGVTDLDLVANLGPDQLDSTIRTVTLESVDSLNSSDNSFATVTSTLSGNICGTGDCVTYLFSLAPERPLVITPGLVTDLTMGVLRSSGYDVRKAGVNDYQGYLNQFQESMIETTVCQHAICLVNDLEKLDSYLDHDLSLGDRFTFDGTTYSCDSGRLLAQDFRFQTRVRRNSQGLIVYDPTTVHLPALVSTGSVTSSGSPSHLG